MRGVFVSGMAPSPSKCLKTRAYCLGALDKVGLALMEFLKRLPRVELGFFLYKNEKKNKIFLKLLRT